MYVFLNYCYYFLIWFVVLKEKVWKGEFVNLFWVVLYFLYVGYYIYYIVKNSIVIFIVNYNEVWELDIKYKYFMRFYNLINVMFEIKNVILDDVGYYSGGEMLDKVRLCGGVVFIVNGEFVLILKKNLFFGLILYVVF